MSLTWLIEKVHANHKKPGESVGGMETTADRMSTNQLWMNGKGWLGEGVNLGTNQDMRGRVERGGRNKKKTGHSRKPEMRKKA
jgi:hypothetical protein